MDLNVFSVDLFQSVLDFRVKMSAEMTPDRYLVVGNLRLEKPPGSTQMRKSRRSYRIL